jgi:branched-chain amino acid transport system ATP-binding protein
MTVLAVEHLAKSYGGVAAVGGIDFTVAAGEMIALIGPNGAGKSTCFNMLSGQIRPDRGSITLFGASLVGLPPRRIWRLGVGRTFQITATFSSMSVLENVQMVLISYHHRLRALIPTARSLYRDEAMGLLTLVGIAHLSDRSCSTLAYGDLKRVELAMALANDPKLLLMDEPTAGMAAKERIELMALTARIVAERKLAVLFTEHDMDVVFTHATRIVVMNRGRVVAEGDPRSVRENQQVQEIYLGTGAVYGAVQ